MIFTLAMVSSSLPSGVIGLSMMILNIVATTTLLNFNFHPVKPIRSP